MGANIARHDKTDSLTHPHVYNNSYLIFQDVRNRGISSGLNECILHLWELGWDLELILGKPRE